MTNELKWFLSIYPCCKTVVFVSCPPAVHETRGWDRWAMQGRAPDLSTNQCPCFWLCSCHDLERTVQSNKENPSCWLKMFLRSPQTGQVPDKANDKKKEKKWMMKYHSCKAAKRYGKGNWSEKCPWVRYDLLKGTVFCFTCWVFPNKADNYVTLFTVFLCNII